MPSAQSCLKKYFGYDSFRPGQLEIITTILEDNDVLAILPTGGGKSICFQIPGLVKNLTGSGTTLVISPLISLMKDQVDGLKLHQIKAACLNSSLSHQELQKNFNLFAQGKLQFLYLAPERLNLPKFLKVCQGIKLNLLAIDEAHCISMWGHDFRPNYLLINNFLQSLPKRPPVAAFTATATPATQRDIIKQLNLKQPKIFLNSFRRDNLRLNVSSCSNQFEQELILFKLLKKYRQQPGIIYTATRKKAAYLAHLIQHYWGKQWPVAAYHAGLKDEARTTIQEQFLKNKLRIICATNAFGMGVDKSNVDWVIHYQVPGNIENYYQEAGRAGRAGQIADCHLIFNPQDLTLQQAFIKQTQPDSNHPRHQHQLQQLRQINRYTQIQACRSQFILAYFGETKAQCQECDNCRHRSLTWSAAEQSYQQNLDRIRRTLGKQYQLEPRLLLSDRVIQLLSLHRPQTKADWAKIPGLGFAWLEKWYNSFSCQ